MADFQERTVRTASLERAMVRGLGRKAPNLVCRLLDAARPVAAVMFVMQDGNIGLKEAKGWVEGFIEAHYAQVSHARKA